MFTDVSTFNADICSFGGRVIEIHKNKNQSKSSVSDDNIMSAKCPSAISIAVDDNRASVTFNDSECLQQPA